jgi:RNA polymerase sigma factor (sigma-70 family)
MDEKFIDLLNNHRGLIYKVCSLYCRDKDDREDLFQEIVLQIWKSFKSFRGESAISTWMYRIALNTAITHLRKEKRSVNDTTSLQGIEIPDLNESDEKEAQLTQLFTAIEKLDKLEKSIVLLYLDGKSYDEISEITGLSKSHVGVKLNRIKTKLSGTLNN